jgi:nucleoside-diphosphate-sugar epimerase
MLPLLRWMQRGLAPRIGSEHARFSLIFVEDLAAAVARVLQRPPGPPGPFELHDGQPGGYRWPDVLAVAARVFGRRIRTVRVPPPVLKAVAAANRRLARWIGYAPMLTPGKVRELTHPDWVCDNTAFSRSTGWAPAVALAKGLEMTMAAGGLQAGRERKG